MKSIMISIQPQWVAKILNGEKTIEIRKNYPMCKLPCKVYIYCTKKERPLVYGQENACVDDHYTQTYGYSKKDADKIWGMLNGKVVAEFTLNKVEDFLDGVNCAKLCDIDNACLTFIDVLRYSNGKPLYAWHIDNLKIYDTPKELNHFRYTNCEFCKHIVYDAYDTDNRCCLAECKNILKRPPQSWCYVEDE